MVADAPSPIAPPATSIVVENVCRRFGELQVLDGVSFTIDAPGVIGLLGANGSGKTTLLRILAQLTAPDTGQVHVAGRLIERGDDLAARTLVGWAPHAPLAWLDDSVTRNLTYAAQLTGRSRRDAAAIAAASITRWELGDVAMTGVRRLSRGWQQRYALARADLFEPPVLLLDEPTTGLDTDARGLLEGALAAWRAERIVLVATHEHEWISPISDRLLRLERGVLA